MTIYTDPDGKDLYAMPLIWNNASPISWKYLAAHGWTRRDEPDPQPEEDTSQRDAAERAIVAAIRALAEKYDATADVEALDDITIPALTELASRRHVAEADLASTMLAVQIQVLQLQAVTGLTWADAWDGLKSRFKTWWQTH